MKDTICAIATLVGESSINVIRISGDDAILIVDKIFDKDLTKKQSYTITYGYIIDGDEKIDEVLVSVFKGPKTFTREDVVEINTHGGKIAVNNFLNNRISRISRTDNHNTDGIFLILFFMLETAHKAVRKTAGEY